MLTSPVVALTTYRDIFLRPIRRQLEAEQFGAFKSVPGPTGQGKTYAIAPLINELRQEGIEKRFIYTTHRHTLLKEMADALQELNIPFVYLKSNTTLVTAFIDNPKTPAFLHYLDGIGFFHDKNLAQVDHLIQRIRGLRENCESGRLSKEIEAEARQKLEDRCGEFMGLFQQGLRRAGEAIYETLVNKQPLIWELFPYVGFMYNPDRPVLLTTVQKLLYGFFDGKRQQHLTSLKDNIIFMDEFEIQEEVMLTYLCQDDGIKNNFEFVSLFYNEMAWEQEIGSLSSRPDDPVGRVEAKQHAARILEHIRSECERGGYNFPAITRFTMSADEYRLPEITVFQSNYISQTYPFYLTDEKRAWRIVRQRNEHTLSSGKLLYLVARAADDILEFFASLWANGLEVESKEWIAHCFNKRNDNTSGAYEKAILRYGVLRRPIKFLKLRQASHIRNSLYYRGFSLYKLVRGKYEATFPDEVEIQQKTLHITPEYLIWQLCQDNLLFGISATGDIPRYVQTFDLKWLEEHCQFLPIDDEDKALIAQMKREKEATRNYAVNLDLAMPLPLDYPLNYFLNNLELEGFFGENKKQIAVMSRRGLVSRFLETARWIVHHSQNQAHLVFANSFAYINKLLHKKQEMRVHDLDNQAEYLAVQHGFHNQEYHLTVDGRSCYVILLDAEKAETIHAPFEYRPEFGPLILVTQYKTASNGVNLEWTDGKGRYDFQGIHLLECKHYYFDTEEDEKKILDVHKKFIWQAWKLAEGRQISQRELQTYLRNWEVNEFNASVYKRTPDYLLNQIALIDQAFGRVDRKRVSTHTTEVRLAHTSGPHNTEDSVFQLLARYVHEEGAIGRLRNERAAYTSTLILNIHEAVRRKSHRQRLSNQFYREDISTRQARCRERIAQLLKLIDQMKAGAFSEVQAQEIKMLWLDVREAMLRQDYQFVGRFEKVVVDFQQDFVHSTAYLQPGDILYLDEAQTTIFREASPDTHEFRLNWPYYNLDGNEAIRHFFDTRNYQLRYRHTTPNYIFMPHALQAILAGAVGEAALRALLEDQGILLERPDHTPTALFEVYDHQVRDKPIFLDAKSFSRETVYRINAKPNDPDYDPELNGPRLLEKWLEKWQQLVRYTQNPATKLVIINMRAGGVASNQYWDAQLNPDVTNFGDSAITLIQGAVEAGDPTQLRTPFQLWLDQVREF